MSRVIKAAHVQFRCLTAPLGEDPILPISSHLLHKADLEELERQAKDQAAEILAKAESGASLMLAQAEERARQLLQTAELEAAAHAEDTRARAYQQGHEAGVTQGLEDGRRLAAEAIATASKTLMEAQERANDRLKQEEQGIAELALALARRIIGQELTTTPAMASTMARQALAKLVETPHAVLRVSTETLPLYRELLEASKAEFRPMIALEIIGDPLLAPGDFLIETPAGTVDGRLDAQLEVLRQALLDLCAERAEHHG